MREFAKVSPQIWTSDVGRRIKNLGLEARVVSLYLQTNPTAHMTGVYYMPVVFIAHEIGMSVEQASKMINELCHIGYCSYDYEYEYVWVHDMGIDQVSAQLKSNDNRVKAINSMYSSLPKLSFLQQFYDKYAELFLLHQCHESVIPMQAPSKSLPSNEKENEKENNNENKNEKEIILSSKPDILCEEQISSIENPDKQTKKRSQKSVFHDQAKEILIFLNEKTKCRFRLEDINLKLIIARLESGASVDECRAVIARKYRDWCNTDMRKYLRPVTLFNPVKFEQYLGECVIEDVYQNGVTKEGLQSETK